MAQLVDQDQDLVLQVDEEISVRVLVVVALAIIEAAVADHVEDSNRGHLKITLDRHHNSIRKEVTDSEAVEVFVDEAISLQG